MYKITEHPILDIPQAEQTTFEYNGQKVTGQKGYTIAAALHQAGFPDSGHYHNDRTRNPLRLGGQAG